MNNFSVNDAINKHLPFHGLDFSLSLNSGALKKVGNTLSAVNIGWLAPLVLITLFVTLN